MRMTEEKLADLTFGVELEYDRIRSDRAARAVAEAVGGTFRYSGMHLRNWVVTMPDGREWNCEYDGSVAGGCETVSPILTIADMPMLQDVVRALRRAGARIGGGSGLHVHVGAGQMTPRQLQNLVKMFYKQEKLIIKGCGTQDARLRRYTRPTDREFVDRMLAIRNPTMATLADAYYHGQDRYSHYSGARYRTLNLHNLWNGDKHTVEFRLFEATTHAGEVRAAVLLAVTMVRRAMDARSASAIRPREYCEESAKYDLRVFLLRLGWIGEMFKAPRRHMMSRMPGSAAWKHGRRDAAATDMAA